MILPSVGVGGMSSGGLLFPPTYVALSLMCPRRVLTNNNVVPKLSRETARPLLCKATVPFLRTTRKNVATAVALLAINNYGETCYPLLSNVNGLLLNSSCGVTLFLDVLGDPNLLCLTCKMVLARVLVSWSRATISLPRLFAPCVM